MVIAYAVRRISSQPKWNGVPVLSCDGAFAAPPQPVTPAGMLSPAQTKSDARSNTRSKRGRRSRSPARGMTRTHSMRKGTAAAVRASAAAAQNLDAGSGSHGSSPVGRRTRQRAHGKTRRKARNSSIPKLRKGSPEVGGGGDGRGRSTSPTVRRHSTGSRGGGVENPPTSPLVGQDVAVAPKGVYRRELHERMDGFVLNHARGVPEVVSPFSGAQPALTTMTHGSLSPLAHNLLGGTNNARARLSSIKPRRASVNFERRMREPDVLMPTLPGGALAMLNKALATPSEVRSVGASPTRRIGGQGPSSASLNGTAGSDHHSPVRGRIDPPPSGSMLWGQPPPPGVAFGTPAASNNDADSGASPDPGTLVSSEWNRPGTRGTRRRSLEMVKGELGARKHARRIHAELQALRSSEAESKLSLLDDWQQCFNREQTSFTSAALECELRLKRCRLFVDSATRHAATLASQQHAMDAAASPGSVLAGYMGRAIAAKQAKRGGQTGQERPSSSGSTWLPCLDHGVGLGSESAAQVTQLVTAVGFEVFDTLMKTLHRYEPLLRDVRDIFLHAVYMPEDQDQGGIKVSESTRAVIAYWLLKARAHNNVCVTPVAGSGVSSTLLEYYNRTPYFMGYREAEQNLLVAQAVASEKEARLEVAEQELSMTMLRDDTTRRSSRAASVMGRWQVAAAKARTQSVSATLDQVSGCPLLVHFRRCPSRCVSNVPHPCLVYRSGCCGCAHRWQAQSMLSEARDQIQDWEERAPGAILDLFDAMAADEMDTEFLFEQLLEKVCLMRVVVVVIVPRGVSRLPVTRTCGRLIRRRGWGS